MRVDAERDSRWLSSSAFPFTVYQKVYLTEIIVSVIYMVKGISSLILAATMINWFLDHHDGVRNRLQVLAPNLCRVVIVLHKPNYVLTNCKALYPDSSKTTA